MMSDVHLPSLYIKGFRTFEQLEIPNLQRINLLVGKNNTGKTSLLEAVYLYANRGSPRAILELLRRRGEASARSPRRSPRYDDEFVTDADLDDIFNDLKHLFYKRPKFGKDTVELVIGTSDAAQLLKIALGLRPIRQQQLQLFGSEPEDARDTVREPAIHIEFAERQNIYPLFALDRVGVLDEPTLHPCIFLRTSGLTSNVAAEFWDGVALDQEFETYLLKGLQLIEPAIEGVAFVASRSATRLDRRAVVGLRGERVPIGSTGEGMNRLLGIMLALVNARDGFLLIDEIEIGLHYTVQVEMWRLIFEMTERLNVQVFATTHSWDCIAALQEAMTVSETTDGQLIRLQRRRSQPEAIQAVVYSDAMLQAATREEIEVR